MNKIISNEKIAKNIYKMVIEGDTSEIKGPGQFINIKLEGMFLRRPISICDWTFNQMTIIYKKVGQGTALLSKMQPGAELDILYPLGNGYTLLDIKHPVLVGGGVGVPPLYGLAKQLIKQGAKPTVILGFSCKEEVFYEEEFIGLGADVKVATDDGSYGTKGFVTDVMDDSDYVYACGPEAMLKAVSQQAKDGQFSFEARMGCGFGACMGCSCETISGPKRICKEGPVLVKEEILWQV